MPRQDVVGAEMLVVSQQNFILFGEHEPSRGSGGVATNTKACLLDRSRIENPELAVGVFRSADGSRPHEKLVVAGEVLDDHVVAEGRHVGHPTILASTQIGLDVRVIEMLVDLGDDDPVRAPSALLPALVAPRLDREAEGLRVRHRQSADFDLGLAGEKAERPVRGPVVVEEDLVDEGPVVPEEERKHPRLVPAERIEMDDRHPSPAFPDPQSPRRAVTKISWPRF